MRYSSGQLILFTEEVDENFTIPNYNLIGLYKVLEDFSMDEQKRWFLQGHKPVKGTATRRDFITFLINQKCISERSFEAVDLGSRDEFYIS